MDRFGTRATEKVLKKVLERWNMSIDQPATFEKCFRQIRFEIEPSKLFLNIQPKYVETENILYLCAITWRRRARQWSIYIWSTASSMYIKPTASSMYILPSATHCTQNRDSVLLKPGVRESLCISNTIRKVSHPYPPQTNFLSKTNGNRFNQLDPQQILNVFIFQWYYKGTEIHSLCIDFTKEFSTIDLS